MHTPLSSINLLSCFLLAHCPQPINTSRFTFWGASLSWPPFDLSARHLENSPNNWGLHFFNPLPPGFWSDHSTQTAFKNITSKLPKPLDTPSLSLLGPFYCVWHYFSFNPSWNSLLLWHLLWVSFYISVDCFLSYFTESSSSANFLNIWTPPKGCFLPYSFIFLHYPTCAGSSPLK